MEGRIFELLADADEGPVWRELLIEELDQGGPLFEQSEHVPVGRQLVGPHVVEEAGCPADEEAVGAGQQLDEGRCDHLHELPLSGAEPRVVEAVAEHPAAEADAGDPLVQVLARPAGDSRVHRLFEVEHPLGHAAGRGDDDDHDELGLEEQHLGMPDRGRLERRAGDECKEPRRTGQLLGRRLQREVDLGALVGQLELERRAAATRAVRARRSRRSGSRVRSAPAPRTCGDA